MDITLLVLSLILSLGGVAYLVYFLRDFIKNPTEAELSKKEILIYGLTIGAITLGATLAMLLLFLFHPEWKAMTSYADHLFAGKAIDYGYQISFALVGSALFALSSALLWSSFALHFYKTRMKGRQQKAFAYLMGGSIPFALLFLLMMLEGLAPYLSYPLINGFSLTFQGVIWTTSADIGNYPPLHIAFYGMIMLFGVFVAYWICDHKFYQEYHQHGLLDSLVLLVFPAGIIGARIWYVVGNYEREFAAQVAKGDIGSLFRVWDGGLTILGGAFAGALAGILYFRFRRKSVNLRWAIDTCLPTVLLAQAVGRWGNFFNSEVYGGKVLLSEGWSWLPNWLSLQMNTSNAGGYLGSGEIHVPLFLIESLLNIAGYFLLAYGLKWLLRRYLHKGDIAGSYFLWYGVVRLIMEPFRDSAFNMGLDNTWSISNSIVYIVLGFAIIFFFHLHDYLMKKERSPWPAAIAAFFVLLGSSFLFLPSLTASTGSGSSATVLTRYSGYELLFSGQAPSFLVAFLLAVLALGAYLAAVFLRQRKKEKAYVPLLYVGIAFSLLSASLFLLGKDWTLLPKSGGLGDISYSLSFGFVLMALALLVSVTSLLAELLSNQEKTKLQRQILENKESGHSETL